jgi:hypothetical protein
MWGDDDDIKIRAIPGKTLGTRPSRPPQRADSSDLWGGPAFARGELAFLTLISAMAKEQFQIPTIPLFHPRPFMFTENA